MANFRSWHPVGAGFAYCGHGFGSSRMFRKPSFFAVARGHIPQLVLFAQALFRNYPEALHRGKAAGSRFSIPGAQFPQALRKCT
jgi:hypothetical protein